MTLANPSRRLNSTVCGLSAWAGPPLILVTDDVRLPDPLAAAAALPSGSGVLLRHYGDPARAARAAALAALCRRRRLVLLVAGDWRLAARLGAAGLHLPEGIARHGVLAPALGWLRRRHALLTVAAHSPLALGRAAALGADAALVSPVFPSRSHPGAPVVGPLRLGGWRRRARLPLIALGGVSAATARRLPRGSVCGLAAIEGLSGVSRSGQGERDVLTLGID
ncbi:thiamine phosphate synthase [Magnetospirillum molischianum]|uniref:Thiamine monophosphate synthase n=1 Tax=Magnetospirillum molischianum DSM 120 TaxID=1150626 RepID=H8FMV5_MAGML|nr:thiamine phosphate synthase [Magnetospirillum molischianum]CCG39693.1 Thiamine monophosphate synthase [Magnetospirillum molischianum DSM 120]